MSLAVRYDSAVIGAGHNGLIAAAYLARAGQRVVVLERRDVVGGACVTEEPWRGYRVSTAAYLCSLLRPEIVRDLELDRRGFEVYRRETAGFAPFPDGSSLFLFADAAKTRDALERFAPEDVEAYFRFEAEIERVAGIVEPFLMREPPDDAELRTAFRELGSEALFEPFMLGSVRDLLEPRFVNEKLKAVLATDGLIGTYGGPSTPGTAYVLLHHYLGNALGGRGAWGYVRGGMGAITRAVADDLIEHGGEIRTNAAVAEIRLDNGCAVGVTLAGGERIDADNVLSNADPFVTFQRMLPTGLEIGGDLVRHGGASAKINLAVSELPEFRCLPTPTTIGPRREHLGTVRICSSLDYLERAWSDAENGHPSTEPMIEIYLQTATDSSLAPPGSHILSLFVQYFPYNLAPGLDLDIERERFVDRVIAIVARYAPNVPDSIIHRQILTSRDLEARFGMTGGHIFHGDLLSPNLWRDRPGPGLNGPRSPVPGLYLCGSGAHPGGCVFGAPGYNAATAVLRETAEQN